MENRSKVIVKNTESTLHTLGEFSANYSFTNLKNESLYMHLLYQCIRQDIVDVKLDFGKSSLQRSFADLGVSTITIENAYAQLLSEGYIYSIPRRSFMSLILK